MAEVRARVGAEVAVMGDEDENKYYFESVFRAALEEIASMLEMPGSPDLAVDVPKRVKEMLEKIPVEDKLLPWRVTVQGTKVLYDGEVYDFAYVGQTGKIILYEEGERNAQDSFAVDPEKVTRK